ncbi:MAG: DUF2238 domain-containing protein [Alphaproteobacteria bacterium]|nr:MAG: DUF2238 domain-containing protein [Alphaproteobacteria bacterium]
MRKIWPILWVLLYAAVLLWSAIHPKDYFTWILEVAPALIGLAILIATRAKFPLTPLLYVLILPHCFILMVGGHYTYAEVPLFDWIKPFFGFERNNFDRLGHFAQGFVPAIIARELMIRLEIVTKPKWRIYLILSVCLAFSAFYELIEWTVAVLSGTNADAFLATQGDIWDTQKDMAMALVGAICALLFLSKWHDRQIAKM